MFSSLARILVVEHSLEALSYLYFNLLDDNFQVEVCNKGNELFARLDRFDPHIIILNTKMPHLNFMLAVNIIKEKNKKLIPVFDEMSDEALIGFPYESLVIVKPIEIGIVRKLIDKFLSANSHPQ